MVFYLSNTRDKAKVRNAIRKSYWIKFVVHFNLTFTKFDIFERTSYSFCNYIDRKNGSSQLLMTFTALYIYCI